ncbi:MAG: amidohydrolase, partial [Gemmataceae bacterium]
MRLLLAMFAALVGLMFPVQAQAAPPVDLLLLNGKIWTGNPQQPEAEGIAIQGDRILAVGKSDDLRGLATEQTRVIDLAGRRVVPGFIDSHVHLLGSGQRLAQVALKDARDEAEFGKRLRAFDKKLPRDRWLLGGDWDHDRTLKGNLPDAALLDKYVPDRLVLLRRYDGHMALVNTRTLKAAGITADTPDPPGGVIYRRPGSKEPTGLLRDNAMGLVTKLIPAPDESEIAESVRAALGEARRLGVTSVVDMDGSGSKVRPALFRHYQQLARAGRLTLRIDLRWPLGDWQELADLGVRYPFGDDWVTIGGLKGFVDGSLGSSTARMFEPYLNEKESTGIYVTPLEKLQRDIVAADRAGLNVAVHAIGDRANAELLDIFAAAARANGPRDRRFRIEHAQHLRPQDIKR